MLYDHFCNRITNIYICRTPSAALARIPIPSAAPYSNAEQTLTINKHIRNPKLGRSFGFWDSIQNIDTIKIIHKFRLQAVNGVETVHLDFRSVCDDECKCVLCDIRMNFYVLVWYLYRVHYDLFEVFTANTMQSAPIADEEEKMREGEERVRRNIVENSE